MIKSDSKDSEQPVRVAENSGILTITLNRPARRNAVNGALARQLRAALVRLDADPSLRVGIVTGEGGNFCAGLDLKALADDPTVAEEVVVEGAGFAGIAEAPPVKPLIAAVEGYALAGGMEIALACDLIVAADDAKFGIPEVKRGLVAGGGALLRLPRQMPVRLATELALTGEVVTADRMMRCGLINKVVPSGEALSAAVALATTITENSPLGVQSSKEILRRSLEWSEAEMFARQQPFVNVVLSSQDAREGALAFAQKRKPAWRGI
jgi:enoyl-CoA hydratase